MSERDELLALLRVRPSWLDDDAPDPAEDEFWDVPDDIYLAYYDNGAQVSIPKLVDKILAAGWTKPDGSATRG